VNESWIGCRDGDGPGRTGAAAKVGARHDHGVGPRLSRWIRSRRRHPTPGVHGRRRRFRGLAHHGTSVDLLGQAVHGAVAFGLGKNTHPADSRSRAPRGRSHPRSLTPWRNRPRRRSPRRDRAIGRTVATCWPQTARLRTHRCGAPLPIGDDRHGPTGIALEGPPHSKPTVDAIPLRSATGRATRQRTETNHHRADTPCLNQQSVNTAWRTAWRKRSPVARSRRQTHVRVLAGAVPGLLSSPWKK
jgi:hypothetical protein